MGIQCYTVYTQGCLGYDESKEKSTQMKKKKVEIEMMKQEHEATHF